MAQSTTSASPEPSRSSARAAAEQGSGGKSCLQAHTDAQILRKDGLLIEARERLLRCAQSDCPAVVIDDCAGWLPSVENSIPTAVFAISDAQGHDLVEAEVTDQKGRVISDRSDGRAVALNPGVYTLKIAAPGFETAGDRLVVRESEKNRIVRVTLAPHATRASAVSANTEKSSGIKPIPAASWILGGTALASGIVAGVSGILYLGAKSDIANKRCVAGDQACESERRDIAARGKTYTTIDQIAGPIAGVSLIAAIIVYAVSDPPQERRPTAQLRVQPQVSASGGGVQLSGRF